MVNNNYIEIVDRIFRITGFIISIADSEGNTLYCQPREDYLMPSDLLNLYLQDYKNRNIADNKPYIYSTKEGIYIGIAKLSDEQFVVAGPSLSVPVSMSYLKDKYHEIIAEGDMDRLKYLCINFSKTDGVICSNLMATLYELIYGKKIAPDEIAAYSFSKDLIEGKNKQILPEYDSYAAAIKTESVFEDKLASAIECGNASALDQLWLEQVPTILKNVTISFEAADIIIIPYITIMRRAALKGGANDIYAFDLQDVIIKNMASKIKPINSLEIVTEASYSFCSLVRQYKDMGPSAKYAKKCEKYILTHINEKITVKDLAHLCGISERQINRVFAECFHEGVNKYIHSEKMRQAKIMLDSGNYTIIEISNYLEYASQSHFTKKFAEYTGCTPGEYKSKNPRT